MPTKHSNDAVSDKLETIAAPLGAFLSDHAESEELIADCRFEGASAEGEELTGLRLDHVVFDHCRLSDCRCRNVSFSEVTFLDCDLSNSDFTDGYFYRCRFLRGKALGTMFTGIVGRELTFDDFYGGFINFAGAKLEHAAFSDCRLPDSSFAEANLHSTAFTDCDLSRMALYMAHSTPPIDFSTDNISGIVLSEKYTELRGATVSPDHAEMLVKMLGIKIR